MDKSRLRSVSLGQEYKWSIRTCALFNLFPEPIFLIHNNGKIIRANKAASRVYGYAKKELHTMNIVQLYANREKEPILSNISRKTMHQRKDESLFPVETRCYPLNFCQQEKLLYLAQDISAKVKAERKAATEEANLKFILENVPVGIGLFDSKGKLIESNAALETILGYEKAELQKMKLWECTHPEDMSVCKKWQNCFLKNTVKNCKLKNRLVKKDGSVIWVNINVTKHNVYGDDNHYIVILEDITDKKNIEQLLKQNMTPLNVVLYGKQSVLVEGLRHILQTTRELYFVGHVISFEDCYALLESRNIEVILVDEETVGGDISKISKKLSINYPDVKLAIFGLSERRTDNYGDLPYIKLQNYSPMELIGLIKSLKSSNQAMFATGSLAEIPKSSLLDSLTDREKQILHLLATGKTNKEIGQEVHLSHSTVRNYVSAILRKLNLPNRTAAAAFLNTIDKKQ
jgi:two-component system nitrate/nitrite response regulator NarL